MNRWKFFSIFDFFFVKKWPSLGWRHPVEGRIFKMLEFGDLNMLTLRIGPFWVDEEKFFRHFFFLPGHARPCPCLCRAYIEPFTCTGLAEKSKYIQNKSTVISLQWKHHSEQVSTNVNLQRPRDDQKTHFFTYWRPSICEISKLEISRKNGICHQLTFTMM